MYISAINHTRDAGAVVGQGGEQESKGTCDQDGADPGYTPRKFVGATPFRLA